MATDEQIPNKRGNIKGIPCVHKEHGKALSEAEIKRVIESISDIQKQALFSVLYLTAGRISEVVNSITPNDIKIDNTNKEIWLFKVYTEKTRGKVGYRNLPFYYEENKFFLDIIKDYMDIANIQYDTPLFRLSRQYVWKLCYEFFDVNPHWIRHSRLTSLVEKYNFSDQRLMLWAGWTDNKMPRRYVHLNWRALLPY